MFPNLEEFKNSKNPGILKSDENKFRLRDETGREYEYICEPGKAAEGRKKIERIVGTMMRDDPYLMEEGNM
jgi:hypothetical protein